MKKSKRTWMALWLVAISQVILIGNLKAQVQDNLQTVVVNENSSTEKFVNVEGRNLSYTLYGEGAPTVVLISGFRAEQSYWKPVIPKLADKATILTYDRPGIGKSEKGDLPQHAMQSAKDLQAILTKTDVPKPYIIVGHSIGTGIARLYASMYPEDVAGLILEDGQHESLLEEQMRILKGKDLEVLKEMASKTSQPVNPQNEIDYREETNEQLRNSGPLPLVPYVVITSGNRANALPPVFSEAAQKELIELGMNLQVKLVDLVPGGKHIIAEGVGHNIHLEKPEILADPLIEIIEKTLGRSYKIKEVKEPFSKEEKTQIIERVSLLLNESYVFPDVAEKIEVHLKAILEAGFFDTISDKEVFARVLTKELQLVSHDKHMRIRKRGPPMIRSAEDDQVLDDILQKETQATSNAGYMRVDILPGNIGYIDLRGFAPLGIGKETASAAMKLLENTYTIIIDLRKNGGGSPAMVQYLCSYFFDEPTHLNSLYYREGDRTEEFWTLDDVSGKKMPDVPLFVLTAQRTFSGAEEFSYNMQTRKRATLIGEVTGGGANPGGTRLINQEFFLFVPTGRAINPVTGTNWEGVGVKPDISVPADSAYDVAVKEATVTAKNYSENRRQIIISSYEKTKQLLEKASALFEEGQSGEAETYVNKGLQKGIDNDFLDEMALNIMGYQYLRENNNLMAIAIFAFNVLTYPESGNTYDSLGEAYLANGDNQMALKYYRKAVELDSGNTNAKKIISELEQQK